MGRVTYIALLTLLYLQWGDSATPLPEGKEYVYHYRGTVQARNSASDEFASQWIMDSTLVMQPEGDDIVMQFKHVATSLFNGHVKHLRKIDQTIIPEEAHQIYLPFVVHYLNNGSASSMSHQPDDPLWSINMKRAIASIIQIDTEHTAQLDGQKYYENSIYGSCEAEYAFTEQRYDNVVTKTITDASCVNQLRSSWSSLAEAPVMADDFSPTGTMAVRSYHFERREHDHLLKRIESRANITYQTMLSERSSQQLVQSQTFRLDIISDITKPIDVTKNTQSASLEYFFNEGDVTFGRRQKEDVEPAKLLSDLRDYYTAFKADFDKYPLAPGDLGINNTLVDMFSKLFDMDGNTVDLTALEVLTSDNEEVQSIFISMLPYIGSNESLNLIRSVIEADGLNDLVAIRLMAILPKYINGYTPDLLKKMELLLNLKEAENNYARHAGILSFAAMVSEANVRAEIPTKQLEQHYSEFIKQFEDAQDQEDKMTYLLSLINLGSLLDSDIMISIIKDIKHSHHIRALATYGFKPFLSSNPEKMFEILWPIVLNQKEHFEMRVAILDLFMSSDLNQQQFDTIVEEFKNDTRDPYRENLQNYLATTRDVLDDKTKYPEYLRTKAADSRDFQTISSYHDAWGTGNYRLSYTDSAANFGSFVQARLVSDPITNALTVIQVTFNQFGMSMNLGTYTAYIKVDGIADLVFYKNYLNARPNREIGIPELLEIINRLHFKMVEDTGVHIEVVLFCDNRVVFGRLLNKANLDKYSKDAMFGDLFKLLVHYEGVSYPKMHVGHMRTDLGTRVQTSIMETSIISHNVTTDMKELFADTDIKTGEWTFRSSRNEVVSLTSYNPLVDVDIGVYKYKSYGQRVHFPISVNLTGGSLIFDNRDDVLNIVSRSIIGTSVDDEAKLAKYCDFCEANVEFPSGDVSEKVHGMGDLGLALDVAQNMNFERVLNFKMISSYRGNSNALPLVEPISMFLYSVDYYRYLGPDVGELSIRSLAACKEPTEYILEWDMNIHDVYNENDPIDGTDLEAEMKISCRRKQDGKILSSIGASYSYKDGPMSTETSAANHVEQKHTFHAHYMGENDTYTICLDREFKYPDRRANIFSISPFEPAKGKGTLSIGSVDKPSACSSDIVITFSDILESEENLMETVQNMTEYDECQKDAVGFKYIPPTPACETVHEVVSKYNNYTLYVDLKNAGRLSRLDKDLRTSDRGFKLLEYSYFLGDYAHVVVSKDLLEAIEIEGTSELLDSLFDIRISLGIFHGSDNPSTVAYHDVDIPMGISTVCGVSVDNIKTFTGKDIDNYETKDGTESVAYVECFNKTHGGLTIQKYSDKKIGFTMWSNNDKLIAAIVNDQLHIELNGVKLDSPSTGNVHFKVYFLADDVIYITNQLVEVYYNTEYISIKTPALYNHYVCGLCAYDDTQISNADNEVK